MTMEPKEMLRNFGNSISKLVSRKKRITSDSDCIERMEQILENATLDDLVTVKSFARGSLAIIDLVHIPNEPTKCFALKKIKKSRLDSSLRMHVFNEKEILSSINCDFILKFYRTFQDSKHLYIMTEFFCAGNVFSHPFNEAGSRFYTGCIVEALQYLHSENIVYRDLKPANLVLDGQGYLKLIGFGLAKKLEQGGRTYSVCGTLNYMAPEVIKTTRRGYGVEADLWALGVLVFDFMIKNHWVLSDNRRNCVKKLMGGMGDVQFLAGVSEMAIDFIQKLCRRDPEERLGYGPEGFGDIKKHRWFEKFDWQALRERKLRPPIVPKIGSATDTRYFSKQIEEEKEEERDSQNADLDPDWFKDF